jgi:hypothetical protein
VAGSGGGGAYAGSLGTGALIISRIAVSVAGLASLSTDPLQQLRRNAPWSADQC